MKISIIGAGNVGASAALLLLARGVADKIALVDINENMALGKALDLNHLCCVFGLNASVKASSDYNIIKNSNICVITAGFARKSGQSRDELFEKNANIVITAAEQIAKFAPKSTIIVVSNPLDAMVFAAFKASKFKKEKVLGMAGELDSARLIFELSQAHSIKANKAKASILGEHGENMVAFKAKIGSKNLNNKKLAPLANKAKNSGATIINLLGTSAYYAPAAGIVKMCEALKTRDNRVLICSAICKEKIPLGTHIKFAKKIKILEPKIKLKKAKFAIKQNCIKINEILKKEQK